MRTAYVVFTGPDCVEVREREVMPPGPGQALVSTTCSLISNGTEITLLRGRHVPGGVWESYGQFPISPGYCNVGVVAEVGEGVQSFAPGDRVTSEGPHAGHYVAAVADLRPIPDAVPDHEAAFATIGEIVMHGVRLAGFTLGESAAVCGLGLLGQVAVQLARFAGAWPVVGVDPLALRRERALGSGATAAVTPEDAAEAIGSATEGRMADVCFEVTGSPDAIAQQIGWLRRMGRLVVVSSPRGPTALDFHDLVNARGTVIIGAHNFTHASVPNERHPWTRHSDALLFLRLLAAGLLRCGHLITHSRSWRHAPDAYADLLDHRGQALAVLLTWDN